MEKKKQITIGTDTHPNTATLITIDDQCSHYDIDVAKKANSSLVIEVFHSKCVINITVHDHASLQTTIIFRSHSKETQHSLTTTISGECAHCNTHVIALGKSSEKHIVNIQTIFDAGQGQGETIIHGIAKDHTTMNIQGCIEITERGSGTQTHLTEHILMLDHSAKVDAIPSLTIRTNEVSASHSASIKTIEEDDLFYFSSRGICNSHARALMTKGFIEAILKKIPDKKLQEEILEAIMNAYNADNE